MKALPAGLADKFILFFCCTAVCFALSDPGAATVPILAAVTFSALMSYFANDAALLSLTAGFAIWSVFCPAFAVFLPLIVYDALFTRVQPVCLAALVSAVLFCRSAGAGSAVPLCILLAVSVWMRQRTAALENLKAERNDLRDSARELNLKLERQNRELLQSQDAEIIAAALTERGRIAREIHDSVGHLLSSSLLQVGAMLAVNRDKAARPSLLALRDTLNEAMDSIRRSVHDLHDESIDLYAQLYRLSQSFTFCPLDFRYDLETDPPVGMKYAFLAIAKEGLTNIIRHSGASHASLLLREHPAFYQLILQNDGCGTVSANSSGIGLQNIRERVESFHGVMNIKASGGSFRIFISVPKGAEKE